MSSDSKLLPLVNGPVVSVAAIDLLCDLEHRGIHIARQGDALTVRPGSALTAEERAALAHWKPHILAMLSYMDTLSDRPKWVQ